MAAMRPSKIVHARDLSLGHTIHPMLVGSCGAPHRRTANCDVAARFGVTSQAQQTNLKCAQRFSEFTPPTLREYQAARYLRV